MTTKQNDAVALTDEQLDAGGSGSRGCAANYSRDSFWPSVSCCGDGVAPSPLSLPARDQTPVVEELDRALDCRLAEVHVPLRGREILNVIVPVPPRQAGRLLTLWPPTAGRAASCDYDPVRADPL